MTTENMELTDQSPSQEIPTRYHLDPSWFDAMGRSFQTLAHRLMCRTHQLGEGSGGPLREAPEIISTIAECCSATPEYNNPSLPVLEVVFRILVTSGTDPLTLQEINERVRSWIGLADGRAINGDVLKRLIDADLSYGIRPYDEGTP